MKYSIFILKSHYNTPINSDIITVPDTICNREAYQSVRVRSELVNTALRRTKHCTD